MLASVKALLSLVVDYAGLFPPAKLSLPEAMADYIQSSSYNWMLGRFVIPASLLNELEELLPTFSLKERSLSVILSEELESEIERVLALNGGDKISVTALEFPPLLPAEIEKVFPSLPAGVEAFFEIPFQEDLEPYLTILRHIGAAAKIRTGGTTIDAFPSMTQLCWSIFSFAKAQVPFKATASLHHPLLAKHRLTSEPDSPATLMHGFLNVAIVAAFAYWQKVTPEEALEILSSVHGFQFKADSISWSYRRLDISEIEAARQHFFRSFGSCSFQEPIDGLKYLKLLS